MNPKRGAAKAVSLSKRKAQPDALDKLGDNPTEAEVRDAAVNVALAELEERVNDVRDSWETDSLFEDVFEELTVNPDASPDDGKFRCPLDWFLFPSSYQETHEAVPSPNVNQTLTNEPRP